MIVISRAAERIRGAGAKLYLGLYDVIFSENKDKKQADSTPKRWEYITLALILIKPCSILGYFSNWGGGTNRLGARGKLLPLPPSPAALVIDII